MWNDPNNLPLTSVKPNTHSDFARPIELAFDTVSTLQPATMEKAKEKWNAMNLALKHGIQRWECSGQGDGGFLEEQWWIKRRMPVMLGEAITMTGMVIGLRA
jgi:hypothetical protein